jgi:hypothetical protein
MIFQLPLGLISHDTGLTARRQGETILDSCGSPAKGGYSIKRSWHDILENHLNGNRCPCGKTIDGIFCQ